MAAGHALVAHHALTAHNALEAQHALGAQALEGIAMRTRDSRYQLVGELGAGSFGQVSLAIDLMTNRRVAIKQQLVPSEEAARELSAYTIFSARPHRHVLTMLDYFVSTRAAGKHARATILSTVHELCSTSLWHVFRGSPGGLAQEVVCKHVQGMAHGAAHLHSMGIVHGDLSLRNVLVDMDGGVKVTDFGTAFSAHVYLVQEEITTGYVQAPEATLGETRQTIAIDAWAVGVATFCLRFGHCPWLHARMTPWRYKHRC